MTQSRSRGLMVGKFWPPHRGHQRALDRLGEESEQVMIVVCGASTQVPDVFDRAMWLQSLYPAAEVVAVDDLCAWHHPETCPAACSERWHHRLEELGLLPVDVVMAGESYGRRFAELLGARLVDPDRTLDGITATAIRANLSAGWNDLDPCVRAGLHRRVVVLGAESTGTSTLAEDLSRELGLPRTGEAGRTLSWRLMAEAGNMAEVTWTAAHFWDVVARQIGLEQQAIQAGIETPPGELGPWLVCDTDTLATIAWWERYLGTKADGVADLASTRPADLYILTSPEGVAFDDTDPLRDGEAIRVAMHERFRELLDQSGKPYITVMGDRRTRLDAAASSLHEFEASHPRWVHS